MRGFLTEGQWEEAQRLAHQLKGSGGNFGCEALAYVAGCIEQQLKQGQHTVSADLLDQFDLRAQELGRVLEILRDDGECQSRSEQLGETREDLDQGTQEGDITALNDTLADLTTALDSNLGDVQDCIDSLHKNLHHTDLRPLVTALQEAFDQFNIPEASSIVEQIRNALAAPSSEITNIHSRI
jgi:HPt (histidine-containing phosphotransfer) domain-containing protein